MKCKRCGKTAKKPRVTTSWRVWQLCPACFAYKGFERQEIDPNNETIFEEITRRNTNPVDDYWADVTRRYLIG